MLHSGDSTALFLSPAAASAAAPHQALQPPAAQAPPRAAQAAAPAAQAAAPAKASAGVDGQAAAAAPAQEAAQGHVWGGGAAKACM